MASIWTNTGSRTTGNRRESTATRNITCFEVLDYDSLTHVKIEEEFRDVVCLIYKRVTIEHKQNRKYALSYKTEEANNKDTKVLVMPWWYLDIAPATDKYEYTGTREVTYLICLLIGTQKFVLNLGSVNVSVSGHYNMSGTNKELIEEDAKLAEAGPIFNVSGNRLYGVSVNCGKKAVTYSYDVESPVGSFSNNVMFQHDSPINAEDYNDYWIKEKRVVGVINYYGVRDQKEFGYAGTAGTAGTSGFPDKVMAIGYRVF